MAARGVIRRLWPAERAKIRHHLLRLDRRDRTLRFGGYASEAHVAAYCERLDWSRALVMGYVVHGKVRGLGQLALIGGEARAAELAVSVEGPFQSRGIGSKLLRRLVIAARNRLIGRIHMVCLMDNGKAVRMARRLGGVLHFQDGEAEARIEPPWPTPWTWLEELLSESALAGVDHAAPKTPAQPASPDRGWPPARSGPA